MTNTQFEASSPLLNVNSSEDEIEFENIEHHIEIENEKVGIDIEDVENGIKNENVEIFIENENVNNIVLENENVDNIENVENEPYVTPNYMRTPKWLLEIDENIIDNLQGKRHNEWFVCELQKCSMNYFPIRH